MMLTLDDVVKLVVNDACYTSFFCVGDSSLFLKNGKRAYLTWEHTFIFAYFLPPHKINPGEVWDATSVKERFKVRACRSPTPIEIRQEDAEMLLNAIFCKAVIR